MDPEILASVSPNKEAKEGKSARLESQLASNRNVGDGREIIRSILQKPSAFVGTRTGDAPVFETEAVQRCSSRADQRFLLAAGWCV